MNEEKKAKKILPSSHSSIEDDLEKIKSEMSEKDVISMQQAGEEFFKKMARNPEKLSNMIKKISNIDPDKLLEKITEGEGNKDDMELMASAIISLSARIEKLEAMYNSLKPKGDVYEIVESEEEHFN